MNASDVQSRQGRLAFALLLALGLAGWEWAAGHNLPSLFFPAPSKILFTLMRWIWQGELWLDIGLTLYRMGCGFLVGGSLGIGLGLLMGWSRRARSLGEPFVAALHPMPKSALLPLFLILMGLGEGPRLALVGLAAFFPLLINTMSSVQHIEPAYLEAAANYGARGWRLFRHILIPASLPGIFSGARIALNTSLTLAITAELLTSQNGLGARIWLAWQILRTENLYATLLVVALLGLLSNALLTTLARRLMPWAPTAFPEQG